MDEWFYEYISLCECVNKEKKREKKKKKRNFINKYLN